MTAAFFRQTVLALLTAIVFLLLNAGVAAASCPYPAVESTDPLHMLVLGDSIMWGQGLRDEEKFTTRVKCWLEEKTTREVQMHVEAHSGAVVTGAMPGRFASRDGEVNLPTPTINEELDHAIEYYKSTETNPALVLVNGCINDVGVKNLLAASTPLENLRAQAKRSCGEDVYALLRRVTGSFPQAHVLLTSYYPIVSEQTDDNAFLRLLVKKLNNQRPEARRMSDREMREDLIRISNEWYNTSTASLRDAVTRINASLPEPKVTFVEIEFGPEHVFAAPDTLLWNFMFASANVSGIARLVAVLSFGTAAYKTNDHVRDFRIKSCEQTFAKPKGVKEPKNDKKEREDLFLICRYASLGHPNQMGALIYTEAIKGRLLPIMEKAGWKREPATHFGQR